MEKLPTYKMVRELPGDAKIAATINGIDLYNMNTFQNIMSWNQHNLDVPAFEYFGSQITYGQLPKCVEEYAKGLDSLGVKQDSVVTISLPVMNEYYLSLFALLNMGAISNNVNFLFLRSDLARYTLEKRSDTIIVLDIYLPLIAEQLQKAGIRNVILTSLNDYLPEEQKQLFATYARLPKKIREFLEDPQKMGKAMGELAKLRHIEFVKMSEIREVGRTTKNGIVYPEFDINRDSIYSYTSGTTGPPKCIVFNEKSPNAIIEMHKGIDLRDYVGDRSLVVIPASHATGMFYAAYLQLSKGKTLVMQPIYDKKTFAQDLKDFNIDHVLAAGSFWNEAAKQDSLQPGDLSRLSRPCTGGEPVTKSNTIIVNKWLDKTGSKEHLAFGGGAGEVGSSALTSYELDPETKTNETGCPIPGVFVKIIDPNTGKEVEPGQRGIIHISSPAAADRYLDDEKATDDYWYYDENGVRYANLGDIAVQNPDGSYTMLGRSSDSYTDKDGVTHYLFDIEYALDVDDPVMEWEISAFKYDEEKTDVVAQVVLKNEFVGKESEIVDFICKKYGLDGVKFYDSFENSEVTGKRDYKLLKTDYEGYFSVDADGNFVKKTYSPDGCVEEVPTTAEEINSHKKKLH